MKKVDGLIKDVRAIFSLSLSNVEFLAIVSYYVIVHDFLV